MQMQESWYLKQRRLEKEDYERRIREGLPPKKIEELPVRYYNGVPDLVNSFTNQIIRGMNEINKKDHEKRLKERDIAANNIYWQNRLEKTNKEVEESKRRYEELEKSTEELRAQLEELRKKEKEEAQNQDGVA